jgi:D-alanine-D-alanine ligase
MGRRFTRVAVLKGGASAEREVSLRSGAAVGRGLCAAGYDVVEVTVDGAEPALPAGIEAVFVALHGTFGEDGAVQELLEARGLPYTGSGPAVSRVCFDKIATKDRLREAGVPTPDFEPVADGRLPALGWPLVVKPACQGSTIGIHKVNGPDGWAAACEDARRYGPRVLAERFVPGRELTVGVVGGEVLPVVEIIAPCDWYDYQAKYTAGQTRYVAPAELPAAVGEACRAAAWQTFEALGCRGMGRVDLRLDRDGQPWVLEINTIPGFTETSLLPKAAAAAGIGFADLCARIMELAAREGDAHVEG